MYIGRKKSIGHEYFINVIKIGKKISDISKNFRVGTKKIRLITTFLDIAKKNNGIIFKSPKLITIKYQFIFMFYNHNQNMLCALTRIASWPLH